MKRIFTEEVRWLCSKPDRTFQRFFSSSQNSRLRSTLNTLLERPIALCEMQEPEIIFTFLEGDNRYYIQINDFPSEKIFSLLDENRCKLYDMDDLPENWLVSRAEQAKMLYHKT